MVTRQLSIRWSGKALEDLDEGLAFIAHFNPEAAHHLRLAIEAGLEQARLFPRAARKVPEAGDPDLREVLRAPFRIMYQVHPWELRILAVRRMEQAFRGPED